jgi:hypothetical protein
MGARDVDAVAAKKGPAIISTHETKTMKMSSRVQPFSRIAAL